MNPIPYRSGISSNPDISAAGGTSGDISVILKNKETAVLMGSVLPGDLIEADLISVEPENRLSGLFSFNGKLFNASIPESLADEFIMGSVLDAGFNIPVKLRFEGINKTGPDISPGNAAAGGGRGSLVFKIVGGSEGLSAGDIQRALNIYDKAYSNFIESNLKSLLAAFGRGESSGGEPGQPLSGFFSPQNMSVSVKGNFLFVPINSASGDLTASLILPAASGQDKHVRKDAPDSKKRPESSKKTYMFMLEAELVSLGRIKLFSRYSDKAVSVNFQNCSGKAKELIGKNLNLFKEMMSSEGISLREVSFGDKNGKNLNAGAGVSSVFSGAEGKIINERI